MKKLLRELHQRPIAVYPAYIKLTDSVTAGMALSQLMYWFSKGKDKIYKTNKELQDETGLSDGEMKSVKRKLKSVDFLLVTREGVPAKTYYTIDWDKYESSMVKITSLESNPTSSVNLTHLDESDDPNCIGKNNPSITETTTETTTKTTQENIVSDFVTPPEIQNSVSSIEDKPQGEDIISYSSSFNLLWSKYKPKHTKSKGNKKKAYEAYLKANEIFDDEQLLELLQNYMDSSLFELGQAHLATFLNGLITDSKYREEFIEGGYAGRLAKVKAQGSSFSGNDGVTAQERYRQNIAAQGPLNPEDLIDRSSYVSVKLTVEKGLDDCVIEYDDRKVWLPYLGPEYVALYIKHPLSKVNKIKVLFHIDELRNNLYVHLHGHEWNEQVEEKYQQSNIGYENIKEYSLPEKGEYTV